MKRNPSNSLEVKSLKVLLKLMSSSLYYSIGGEGILLVEYHAEVLWELVLTLGLWQSQHCDDVEFL